MSGHIKISVATATTTELIAATTKRLRVVGLTLQLKAATTDTAKFQSGSTDLTGTFNGGVSLPFSAYDPGGLFEVEPNEALNLVTVGATVNAQGFLHYVEV